MNRVAVALLLALLLPGSASAVEPKRPSELLTLEANDPCDLGRGQIYDLRVHSDGSTSPFTIPAGYVVVVTRWMYQFYGGTGGKSEFAFLKFDGTSTSVGIAHYTYDSEGNAGGTLELSGVVGAGEKLCGTHGDSAPGVGSLGGLVEGYLVKAK